MSSASRAEISWFLALAVLYPAMSFVIYLVPSNLKNDLVLIAGVVPFSPLLGFLSLAYGLKSHSLTNSSLVGILSSVFALTLLLVHGAFVGPGNLPEFASFYTVLMVGSFVGFSLMGLAGNLKARLTRQQPTKFRNININAFWAELGIAGFVFWAVWTWTLLILRIQSGQ